MSARPLPCCCCCYAAVLALGGQAARQAAPPGARLDAERSRRHPRAGSGWAIRKAKVKLVEYGSLDLPALPAVRGDRRTSRCSHNYVRTGKVSYEFRNYVLNGPDISVAPARALRGAAQILPDVAALYATQPEWIDKVER